MSPGVLLVLMLIPSRAQGAVGYCEMQKALSDLQSRTYSRRCCGAPQYMPVCTLPVLLRGVWLDTVIPTMDSSLGPKTHSAEGYLSSC